jgi:hypothetical protein
MTTLHEIVADKLESADHATRGTLLRVPLANIDRWLANGVVSTPEWLLRWRELLEQAMGDEAAFQRVLHLLRSDTQEAIRWKEFSPFAGVLTTEERRAFFRQCAYSH